MIGVVVGFIASATAAVAAALIWLPSDPIQPAAAARLDASLVASATTPSSASTPSAPASSALANLAASKAGKAQAPRGPRAKAKPERGKPSAKVNASKPIKKAPKAVTKRVKPATKKRPAPPTANS